MKIAEDVRKYTVEQGVSEKVALKKGTKANSKDSSRREASEKAFARQKAAGRGCGSSRANSWKKARRFTRKHE